MATGRVLLVEDDASIRRAYQRILVESGQEVHVALDGAAAAERLLTNTFDVVVSDLWMPRMGGIALLERLRASDNDVSVILMSGAPTLDSARSAVTLRAFRYLEKPVSMDLLKEAVSEGVAQTLDARRARRALNVVAVQEQELLAESELRRQFENGLAQLWIAYQPIVHGPTRTVFACEALARTGEGTMRNPLVFFDTAARFGETRRLSRRLRALAAEAPLPESTLLFVNLVPSDLMDDELYSTAAPLTARARRTVLEITERASLDEIKDLRDRLTALRQIGFRFALDDMGEGYAGLTSLAKLDPNVLKLDMSLIRGLHESPTKQCVVQSMVGLGASLSMTVLAEGVETVSEMETLLTLGCQYFQGYLFAKPAALPFNVTWPGAKPSI